MRANVCVCVSLEWLATKLCQIHDRLSVDQQYLLAINTELVHLIETDLNSETTHCSLLESLHHSKSLHDYRRDRMSASDRCVQKSDPNAPTFDESNGCRPAPLGLTTMNVAFW